MNSKSLFLFAFLPLATAAAAQEAGLPLLLPTHAAGVPSAARGAHAPDAREALLGQSGWRSRIERERVDWNTAADGTLWARGAGYKASFDAQGATYVPFLGSNAPRNFPVRFRLAALQAGADAIGFDALAAPVRAGESVRYERGALREVYELRPEGVEQLFVLDPRDFAGELVLRLELETELAPASDAQGLVFGNEFGGMRYSSAVTVDEHGTRRAAPTGWKDGAIEIRVPASTLAEAHGALTIDPFLGNYAITGAATNEHAPDVAWDESSQRQAVVYESDFSATDHDVGYILLNVDGTATGFAGWIDFTTVNVAHPRIANNGLADNFMCVTQQGPATGGTRDIYGCALTNAGVITATFLIANGSNDLTSPVIGGDNSSTGPTYYFVAWEANLGSSDHDIQARLVASDGTLLGLGTIGIDSSFTTYDQEPQISRTNGGGPAADRDWTIVWTRATGLFGKDLYGARVHCDGTITDASYAIDTLPWMTYAPSVSSPIEDSFRQVLLTYTQTPSLGADTSIVGRVMHGPSTTAILDIVDAVGGLTGQLQFQSATDSDGRDFTVAWTELSGSSSTDTDVYEATLTFTGHDLVVAGAYQTVFATPKIEDEIALCSTRSDSGTPRRMILVAHGNAGSQGDIYGARMDQDPFARFCSPGTHSAIACPCGNAPLAVGLGCNNSVNSGGGWMDAQGSPDLDTVGITGAGMKPNATCVFLQGALSLQGGVAFGDGVRCAGGQLLRLAVKTVNGSGNRGFPEAGDPSIKTRCLALGAPINAGETRAYQVYYRDPPSFACAAPATFNITSAVQVRW